MSKRPENLRIRTLEPTDLQGISDLGDQIFGPGYIAELHLEQEWEKISQVSFVLASEDRQILGVRLSYPPGQWAHLRAYSQSHPELWPAPTEAVGYFKLAMVEASVRGQGWGRKLAEISIGALKSQGAIGVITHSWNQSPGNSSGLYTKAIGFQPIADIPNFWADYDYTCDICLQMPCRCSASELFLEI